MALIVIEGLDGAGSSTQVNLLSNYLKSIGKKVGFIHFPDYEEKYTGELISKYLRGEYLSINQNIMKVFHTGGKTAIIEHNVYEDIANNIDI